jgi:hypothetical protein
MPSKTANQMKADRLQIQETYRLTRLMAFTDGTLKSASKPIAMRRTVAGKQMEPNIKGLGDRTASYTGGTFQPREIPTGARHVTDAQMRAWKTTVDSGMKIADAGKIINPDITRIKQAKAADYIGTYYMWNGVLQPEYDMREPHAIVDTEVYVKQMVHRKLALAARAGYEIMSDRDEDAEYIQHRIDVMEFVSERSFPSLLKGILYNLFTCSNCFVHKLRKEDASPVPRKKGMPAPVAAYSIIPAHTIQPYLEHGRIVKWRRFFDSAVPWQDIPVEDIIHFKWSSDLKAGHIYATPRTIAVRDDIFALRRLEENVELLFINHLFPLFHVQVGTAEAPCTYGDNGESEIDLVRWQIENMPKEGVYVSDERVKISAVGAEGKSLDFSPLVTHYKSRVYVGLGMSAIDMGEGADATRATADNISQNLKDSIKADLDDLADQIRMFMFRDWFMEANYSTSVQKGVARTFIRFHELDLDNRIKEETHVLALFNSHLITEDEARKRLKYKAMTPKDRGNTHFSLHVVKLEKEITKFKTASTLEINAANVDNEKKMAGTQIKLMEAQAKLSETKTGHEEQSLAAQAKHLPVIAKAKVAVANATARKGAAGAPRRSTAKKTTQTAAAVSNKMRPTNQHGSGLGPTKAKSSRESFMGELYEGLLLAREDMISDGQSAPKQWQSVSSEVVDQVLDRMEKAEITGSGGDSYTRQVRDGLSRLKAMIAETSDPELLSVLLREGIEEEVVDDVELHDALAS